MLDTEVKTELILDPSPTYHWQWSDDDILKIPILDLIELNFRVE